MLKNWLKFVGQWNASLRFHIHKALVLLVDFKQMFVCLVRSLKFYRKLYYIFHYLYAFLAKLTSVSGSVLKQIRYGTICTGCTRPCRSTASTTRIAITRTLLSQFKKQFKHSFKYIWITQLDIPEDMSPISFKSSILDWVLPGICNNSIKWIEIIQLI